MENGQTVLSWHAFIYHQVVLSPLLSPSYNVLVLYTPDVDAIVGSDDDKMSIILTGHFNVNFVSEVKLLIEFLKRALNLTMNTDARERSTRYGTMIDTFFSRFLYRLQSRIVISYLSFLKYIVSFL
ncbi:hypothetical protein TNIN_121081 [Trichonephila inaurata madagascariensis]|uniref:Uncharacterized protein n=1 Tax=Trichonephila inaurata madagascariensis TaxID=2747483 RepID=A0A8X6XKC8_9ARAC|nr:hypothetical protein TNIN_121081 [Trichonephila inaurata madagascariensis]